MLSRAALSKSLFLPNLKNFSAGTIFVRNGSHGTWSYRMPPPAPSKRSIFLAETLGGLCWFWITYHIATEPEHIFGEWTYVDPSTYTDEELGIPPDSAGPQKRVKK